MVGAVEGLEKIRVVDSFSLVKMEQRSGPRSRRDRGWCRTAQVRALPAMKFFGIAFFWVCSANFLEWHFSGIAVPRRELAQQWAALLG